MRHPVDVRLHAQDPAEAWEITFTETEGGAYFRRERGSYPYTPRRAEEVPAGALKSLEEACGVEALGQIFIIPWAVRSTGQRGEKVIAPNSVLGLGEQALGLWTEKPVAGVKLTIPLDKVAAIEDVIILLYGRLSFIPFGDRLTIRYNAVAREGFEPALQKVRRKLAGSAQAVPATPGEAPELPFKWKGLLGRPFVSLEEMAPVASCFAAVPGRFRREAERGQLLALNPFELVYLCDPAETTERYGVDSFIVPRSRVTGVQVQEENLAVSSNGARFLIPMASPLREAAVRWLT